MKKFYTRMAAAICALVAISSCSLDEVSESSVRPEDFFNSEKECISALNGCYIPLKAIHTQVYMMATEGITDLLYINSTSLDSQLLVSPATPRFGTTMWTQAYQGVRNCTTALHGIENSELPDETRLPLEAEARIMRAYYYYLLTCFFGDVPFYEDYIYSLEDLERVAHLPRMSAVETRKALIDELYKCVPDCAQERTSDVKDNRSGAALGWMLVGKFALWNEDWETVIDAVSRLEFIYGSLDQYPLEDVKFRYKNTPESIFEIQHTYEPGGLQYTSSVAAIFMPRPRKEGTCIYAGVEVPELGNLSTVWVPMRPNQKLCAGLLSKTTKDLRKDMVLAWSYNGNTFDSVNVRPWMGPKWWCPGLVQTYDSNNYKIFRFADALLMKSEAYCELGEYEKSMEYLNFTRRRAGLDDYTKFRSKARLFDEIKNERGRELVGEFQRKYDLVRWGTWYNDVVTNSDGNVVDNIKPCHEYYPIPDVEVSYSGGALDNKAYEAFGY